MPAICPYPEPGRSSPHPPHPTSWRHTLILSSHLNLVLLSALFTSGFPTKTLYAPLFSPIRATCPAHLILLDFITRTIFGEQYRSLSSSLCSFLHSIVSSNKQKKFRNNSAVRYTTYCRFSTCEPRTSSQFNSVAHCHKDAIHPRLKLCPNLPSHLTLRSPKSAPPHTFPAYISLCVGPVAQSVERLSYRAGRSGIESWWGRDIPLVQTGPGAHPASCTMRTVSFPGVKCGRDVLLTTHPLLVPRSWKSRAIPLPTLWGHTGPVTGSLYVTRTQLSHCRGK